MSGKPSPSVGVGKAAAAATAATGAGVRALPRCLRPAVGAIFCCQYLRIIYSMPPVDSNGRRAFFAAETVRGTATKLIIPPTWLGAAARASCDASATLPLHMHIGVGQMLATVSTAYSVNVL